MNKNELENSLVRIHEWIRSADEKISIWLAFQGIFIVLLAPYIFTKLFLIRFFESEYNTIILSSGIVFISYGIYKTVSSLIPRLKNNTGKRSLIYFGDISRLNLKDFINELESYSDTDYLDDLKKQIFISSKISSKKHSQFRDSVIYFFIGVIILSFFYLVTVLR
jgi:hypothetical protein